MPPIKDITGMKFGSLTVISMYKKIKNSMHWNCLCECGNEITVNGAKLRNGHTKSCGCYKIKRIKETNSRDHNYIDKGNFYEVLDMKGDILFLVDKDKKYLVEEYRWKRNKYGYILHSSRDGAFFLMHRIVTNAQENDIVDHINGSETKYDNRISNLRVTSQQVNSCNRKVRNHSKSGILGINATSNGKFISYIMTYGKQLHLGTFATLEEAIKVRQNAEMEQRGELSYFWNSEEYINNLKKFKIKNN